MLGTPDAQRVPPAAEQAPWRAAQSYRPPDFDALLLGLLSSAYGYALRLTRNRADAEDLVQEAALLACRGAATFEPGTNFKAWFFRILVRAFWARHRTVERRPVTVDLDDTPDLYLYARSADIGRPADGDTPATLLLDQLGTERIIDAIAQLPEEYGTVCTLYFMEDLTYQDIAGVLGLPIGTVRSRLHRGRRMLQKSLWRAAEDAGIIGTPTGRRGAEIQS
jgi:RNA polymerase sigma-70 factor (ECF subfamily)